MRSVIDILDLTVEELDGIIATAEDILAHPDAYADKCRSKKLATLFFEPSTRTRMSFEAAMLDLGGSVLSMASAASSSATKGESVADTAKVISQYADVIAMRHPKEGAALVAAKNAEIPVINAGDGGHCHPTQTLADLLTIHRRFGTFDGLTVGFCGDLKYGRTVHSLINALVRYHNVKFVLISPEELKLPDYSKQVILNNGNAYEETADLTAAIPALDVLYMTRVQQERFENRAEYERLKDTYILTTDKLAGAKENIAILHPLPRVNEISVQVDAHPGAAYFEQVKNGKFMRMALILFVLSHNDGQPADLLPRWTGTETPAHVCKNPACITHTEQELAPVLRDGKCVYCEQ